MTITKNEEETRVYQIGTVSSLTGVDAHTIRAWERRYGAIKPNRSDTGRRLYDDQTVERLQLLKALVDCNEAIGQIAHLPDDTLRERLGRIAEHEAVASLPRESGEANRQPRIAVLSSAVAHQMEANGAAFGGLDAEVHASGVDAFLSDARGERWDIVVLEIEEGRAIAAPTLRAAQELPGRPAVLVVYRFATNATLAKLGRAGAVTSRLPLPLDSLRRILDDMIVIRLARQQAPAPPAPEVQREAKPGGGPIERRFDDAQLARLLEVSTAIDCECPNHLSSLVSGLVAFEQYSRDCESRDEQDAAQHRRLAEGTGEARAVLEQLLVELCEHENIQI
ncbi:MAG: MerR family transcriptional regulator [Myxococcota bacterium]